MATYVIGDIHGCYDTLQALWARLEFDDRRDRLWLTGDLVNRGPRSLDVLRWARERSDRLGDRMQTVLGNHDLHLLARHDGYAKARRKDTLEDVLAAPDRDQLIAWLARRPLVHRDGETLLVHAGLLPHWSPEETEDRARRVEAKLRDPERRRPLLDRDHPPPSDDPSATAHADLWTLAGLRTCTAGGEPCDFKGPPAAAPAGCLPWFRVPGRRSAGVIVVFGHWAAMGLRLEPGAIGLDSGCVWGQRLTAIRLEDRAVFQKRSVDSLSLTVAVRGKPG